MKSKFLLLFAQGKKIGVYSLCVVVAGSLMANYLAEAGELPSELRKGKSPQFEGYYYDVYEFKIDSSTGGSSSVAVVSDEFDAFLMLIDPEGDVSTNHDYTTQPVDSSFGDAGLPLAGSSTGRWLAISTTLKPGAQGKYTFRHDGVTGIRRGNRAQVDLATVERAFMERGVLSSTERREEERVAKVESLTEQLSLGSYRNQLKGQLALAISDQGDSYEASRLRLDELELRERVLQNALADVNKLPESEGLVRELVEKELAGLWVNADRVAMAATGSLAKREGFNAALEALNRLDNTAAELERAQESLLSANGAEELLTARAEITRILEELSILSTKVAEKLLDSRIVVRMRFGGFRSPLDRVARIPTSLRLNFTPPTPGGTSSSLPPGVAGDAPLPPWVLEQVLPTPLDHAAGTNDVADTVRLLSDDIDVSVWLTGLLPWPPPTPSSQAVIGREYFEAVQQGNTLGTINGILVDQLVNAGYRGSRYFGVPHGFAIVTRLEQTDGNGAPLNSEDRWSSDVQYLNAADFSIKGYLRLLLTSPPGYFRVIAFVVSNQPFSSSGVRERLETLERWTQKGLNTLPSLVSKLPYTEEYQVTALIYEFEKVAGPDQPVVHIPGRLTAGQHLGLMQFAEHLL